MSPFWLHPGPAELQRSRAEYIDPYPEPDIGPQMQDVRPRDYLIPPAENSRAQNERSFTQRYQQAPPVGTFRPSNY
jgi:hypothetical protein